MDRSPPTVSDARTHDTFVVYVRPGATFAAGCLVSPRGARGHGGMRPETLLRYSRLRRLQELQHTLSLQQDHAEPLR
jgi:hypothetical protein